MAELALSDEQLIQDSDLPVMVAWVKQLIGIGPTLDLVRAYGGNTLYMPAAFDPTHPIVPIIGHEAAAILMDRLRQERIYLPKCDGALRIRRNVEISHRYEGGTPVRHLAHDYGLSERQIWSILKRPETLRDSPQADLFATDSDD